MPPFAAGDSSHSLNSFSDGALALMCPNLLFFAPVPLRDKARHRRWMSALAPRLQASLKSRNSKDSRCAISRRLCLFSTFPSRQIPKLAADQVPSKNSSSRLSLCPRRHSQSPSFCQDFSPFQRGSFLSLRILFACPSRSAEVPPIAVSSSRLTSDCQVLGSSECCLTLPSSLFASFGIRK